MLLFLLAATGCCWFCCLLLLFIVWYISTRLYFESCCCIYMAYFESQQLIILGWCSSVATIIIVGNIFLLLLTLATPMTDMHISLKSTACYKTRGRCITQLANMSIDPRIHRTHSWRFLIYLHNIRYTSQYIQEQHRQVQQQYGHIITSSYAATAEDYHVTTAGHTRWYN